MCHLYEHLQYLLLEGSSEPRPELQSNRRNLLCPSEALTKEGFRIQKEKRLAFRKNIKLPKLVILNLIQDP